MTGPRLFYLLGPGAVGSRAVQHGSRRRALQGVGARSGARDPGRTTYMRARARIPHFARDAPRSPTTRPVLIRAEMNRRKPRVVPTLPLCRHPALRHPRFAWGLRLVPTRVAVEVGLCERSECEHGEAPRLIEEQRVSAVLERAAISGIGSPRPRTSRSPRRGGILSSGARNGDGLGNSIGLQTPKAAPNASGEWPDGGHKTRRLAGKSGK
jgi:hypothetical protein